MINEFEKYLGIDEIKANLDNKNLNEKKRLGKGCALCSHTGYLKRPDGTYKMCSCYKNAFYKELFEQANVPQIYLGKTIEDWNTRTDSYGNDLGVQQHLSERIYTILTHYDKKLEPICNGFNITIKHSGNSRTKLHSLKFIGGTGSGKTFIASVLVQSAIKKNLLAKYYEWSDILDCIIDFNKKNELEEIRESFNSCDFIAIDGLEFFNCPQSQIPLQLDRLAKARINSGKPIVFLGSNSMDQIQGGSGWQSLLNNCLTFRLPNAIK